MNEDVKWPCISVCVLEHDDLCTGCFRTADEITRWTSMPTTEKQQVVSIALERRQESGLIL